MATKISSPAAAAEAPRGSRRSSKDRAVTRLTADLPNRDADLLTNLSQRTGYNKLTTLIRALRILDVIEDARERGETVIIERSDGSRERLLLT